MCTFRDCQPGVWVHRFRNSCGQHVRGRLAPGGRRHQTRAAQVTPGRHGRCCPAGAAPVRVTMSSTFVSARRTRDPIAGTAREAQSCRERRIPPTPPRETDARFRRACRVARADRREKTTSYDQAACEPPGSVTPRHDGSVQSVLCHARISRTSPLSSILFFLMPHVHLRGSAGMPAARTERELLEACRAGCVLDGTTASRN